jgi:voltage-gated potassium channel
MPALDRAGPAQRTTWLRRAEPLLVGVGLAMVVLGTLPQLEARDDSALTGAALVVSGLFGAAFVERLWQARGPGWRRAVDAPLLLDLLGALAVPLALLAGLGLRNARLFGVVWLIGLVRRTSAFRMVGRVLRSEREPLLGVLGAFLVVLFVAATLAYLLERDVQPAVFGSIPAAMWWGIVTITTTGYGDAVPATPAGRMLAGLLMVTGIAVFALWAGILASGFGQELRRREFVRTWELVAQVPLFRSLGAGLITEISRLLRPRRLPTGRTVMRRGEPGDCMYFIADGELEVQLAERSLRLGPGAFVGELALITGAPRMATVVTTQPSTLLTLEVAEFRELAASRPELLHAIEVEASRRGQAAAPGPDALA